MDTLNRRLAAEALGTAFLLAVVIGSGIMGDSLAAGNDAVALLGNTAATGAILYVLITILGPLSGAHFNPAVTLMFWIRGDIPSAAALLYVLVQAAGGLLGMAAAHLMFELPVVQLSSTVRAGPAQWLAEFIATFGLLFTILGCVRYRPESVAAGVGLYITAGYWFTASTSFANPAVTLARAFTDTFAGIRPVDAPGFIAMQLLAAAVAATLLGWLFATREPAR